MAGYTARKAPDVAQYVANLNAIPSAHDMSSQHDDNFNIENELAQFTNAEFLEFETNGLLEPSMQDYALDQNKNPKRDGSPRTTNNNIQTKPLDFSGGTFPSFPDLNFLPPAQSSSLSPQIPYTSHATIPDSLFNPSVSPISFSAAPYPGHKHSLASPPSMASLSPPSRHAQIEPVETAASRHAAEEDKRRRNTAASARFRVKKKQREQALEHTAKELENKASLLEQRIGQLETENEWLRGLVVEKHGGEKEDLRLRWKKDTAGEAIDRKTNGKKKGVGTESSGSE